MQHRRFLECRNRETIWKSFSYLLKDDFRCWQIVYGVCGWETHAGWFVEGYSLLVTWFPSAFHYISNSSTVIQCPGSARVILTPSNKHCATHAMQPKHRSPFATLHLPLASVWNTLTRQTDVQSFSPLHLTTSTLNDPRGQSVRIECMVSPDKSSWALLLCLVVGMCGHPSTIIFEGQTALKGGWRSSKLIINASFVRNEWRVFSIYSQDHYSWQYREKSCRAIRTIIHVNQSPRTSLSEASLMSNRDSDMTLRCLKLIGVEIIGGSLFLLTSVIYIRVSYEGSVWQTVFLWTAMISVVLSIAGVQVLLDVKRLLSSK